MVGSWCIYFAHFLKLSYSNQKPPLLPRTKKTPQIFASAARSCNIRPTSPRFDVGIVAFLVAPEACRAEHRFLLAWKEIHPTCDKSKRFDVLLLVIIFWSLKFLSRKNTGNAYSPLAEIENQTNFTVDTNIVEQWHQDLHVNDLSFQTWTCCAKSSTRKFKNSERQDVCQGIQWSLQSLSLIKASWWMLMEELLNAPVYFVDIADIAIKYVELPVCSSCTCFIFHLN